MAAPEPDRKPLPSAAKQALAELRRMQAKLDAAERQRREPVAICGVGMRFPGNVVDSASYWRLLSEGVDAITGIPPSRWNIDDYYDPDPAAPGKMYSRHGGFLSGVEDFDAEFFGLSPREAECTDPQQRLLLEVAWEALENAAIAPRGLARSRSGVFLGVGNSDYGRLLIREADAIDAHTGTGSAIAVAAGRLSYGLGLSGPSMVVDTACSSSLTAVSLACESLRRHECDLALAGGSSLILTPEYNIAFSKARMLAPDGRCKTFDARADGYVRGEGCAIVVLKRLSDALRDDDPILAVVRGYAVNQDGASSGLTVPNGPAQETVIREALANAGVAPEDVDYVEAHGTATSLGDPIEVHALGAVFGRRAAGRPLRIGSVKSNFGHLEAAAGVAGIIKVALSLQHGRIPATLHFEQPSPRIDWSRCDVAVATELTPWPDGKTRIAGVSSFGFSGTNAHVVLAEAPRRTEAAPSERSAEVLPLSAAEPAALRQLAGAYAAALGDGSVSLAEFAWTAQTGRSHLRYRAALAGNDIPTVRQRLLEFAETGAGAGTFTGQWFEAEPPGVTFLFAGDAPLSGDLGHASYTRHAVFRAALDECDALLADTLGESLLAALHGGGSDRPLPARVAQPAQVALAYAQAQLWRAWGVQPTAVCGVGLGEYAAACIAGVYDIRAALALAAARGRLYEAAAPRALLAVSLSAERMRERIGQAARLFVMAENGPASVVVGGEPEAIETLAAELAAEGVELAALGTARIGLPDDAAGREAFARLAQSVDYRPPQLTYVSGRLGRAAGAAIGSPEAWIAECGSGTRFWPALQALRGDGERIFLEIGMHPALSPLARRALPDADCCWLAAARRDRDDGLQQAETLAALYAEGVDPAWRATRDGGPRRAVLPTYPFQRERFWWRAAEESSVPRKPARRWEQAVSAGRLQSGLVPMDMRVDDYAGKWEALGALTDAFIVAAFRTLGLYCKAGETHTPDSLLASGGIKPVYRMLMSRWLGYLATAGLLERDGNACRAPAPLDEPDLGALRESARQALADIPPLLEYVERCGALLPDVLTGRESALETLFPGGATETARFLYRDWAVPRYFNQIAASVTDRFVTTTGRAVRLVEIGAGTGATTASVLPQLAGRDVGYWFTDVSDYFLGQAREAFKEYEFVRYGLLDIGRSPAGQGYGAHGFDVVIAANVLHATDNLEDTVDHVLSLLAPGGILVLYETTGAPRWSDITVSLIEGWQSFKDTLRTDHPLLPAERWAELLRARGFADVVSLPEAGSTAEVLGSHIIVAQVAEDRAVEVEAAAQDALAPAASSPAPAAAGAGEAGALRRALDAAAANERHALAVDFVRGAVNRVLRRDPRKPLDRRQRLMDLGVDSLMAVELRNVLTTGLALEEPLPATLIFDHPTIEAVAKYLEACLAGPDAEPGRVAGAATAPAEAVPVEDVDALSDDDVEAALRARINEA